MTRVKRTWYAVVSIAIFLILVTAAGLTYWRTTSVLRSEQRAAESERSLRTTVRPLVPAPDNGFEWLSTPAQFSEAAQFNGHLYVAGPAGLTEYDGEGHQLREFRVGRELPPAPLLRAIVATLPGSHRPELVIATRGAGVIAFDGKSLRQIVPDRAESRSITALLSISSGQLLLGTEKAGLLAFNGTELKPFHSTLSNASITELAGNEGDLWVGTADRGVAHWHGGTTDWFTDINGLPDAHVYAIAITGDQAFIGTAAGIAEFQAGQFVRVLAPGAFVRALYIKDKTLLAGTMDDGLLQISLEASRQKSRRDHETFGDLRADIKDVRQILSAGDALIAVADSGVFLQTATAGWQKLIAPGTRLLADGNISSIAVDPGGRIWVGYFDRGLDVVDLAAQRSRHIEDDHVFCVNRVLPGARKGVTAVATANGLVLIDDTGTRRQVISRRDGLIADHVTDIAPFGDGLALATPAGLTFLDSTGARSLYAFQGLVNNHVYALATNGHRLLAGTLGGASILEGDQVRVNYTTATSALKHNWITAAVYALDQKTQSGGFWLGTYGAGVVHMDDSGHFEAADGVSANLIVNPGAIVADGTIVAAGTLGRGLYIMDRSSRRWRAITEGLPSLNVTALTINNGYLYVGTDNGLVRIALQRLAI